MVPSSMDILQKLGLPDGFPLWPPVTSSHSPENITQWQQQWKHAVTTIVSSVRGETRRWPENYSSWPVLANAVASALMPWWGPYGDDALIDETMEPVLEALGQLALLAPPRGHGWLVLGQINPTPCRLNNNARQIRRSYQLASVLQADALICPELSLMGYPVGDVILRMPTLVDDQMAWLDELIGETKETSLVIGFAEPVPELDPVTSRAPFYNAVAIARNGKLDGVVRKQLLPNYNEYTDSRLFRPSPSQESRTEWDGTLGGGQTRYGLAVCYDWWHQPNAMPERSCPVAEWMSHRPDTDVLINCSASPSRTGKLSTRMGLFQRLTDNYDKPLVYVNQAGGIDEHVFDGASSVISADGHWVARGPAFQPALWMVNPQQKMGCVAPAPESDVAKNASNPLSFDPTHADDVARTIDAVTYGIAEYFNKSGLHRAILGLSGGLDSSITAVLAVRALGASNVLGVFMPSGITQPQSQADMEALVNALGMPSLTLPIESVIAPFQQHQAVVHQQLVEAWGKPSPNSYAADNIQATSRASLLRMLANDYHALPLATSDKSELYMGYATVNGDMSGALAPLGDVVKTKLFAIGAWLNQQSGNTIVPESVLTKPPGAELAIDSSTGKPLTAEDALMPYVFADEVIFQIERYRRHPMDLVSHSFVYEKIVAPLTQKQKQLWLEKFTWRMQTAAFKWWVAPPILITDADGSLAHRDYMHPTVAYLLRK